MTTIGKTAAIHGPASQVTMSGTAIRVRRSGIFV